MDLLKKDLGMLGWIASFIGATLGSMLLGSVLYGVLRPAFGTLIKNSLSCYLISILLSASCVVLLSAWGLGNGGAMNWIMSSLYIPGLILVGFVFYRRDVRGKPA